MQSVHPFSAAVLTAFLCGATAASAAPPEVGPLETVVTNTESNPVPVQIQPAPLTVLCTRDIGGGSTSVGPYFGFGSGGMPSSSVKCPFGIEGVQVTKVGFSPDVGGNSTFKVTSYRVVVGYDNDRSDDTFDPPAGVLGILSENVPVMEVMQPFHLDTTDTTPLLFQKSTFSSGFETQAPSVGGTLFFIGIPTN